MKLTTLPKIEKKKIISNSDFVKLAKKVQKSFEEEANYLMEKRHKHGDSLSTGTYTLS